MPAVVGMVVVVVVVVVVVWDPVWVPVPRHTCFCHLVSITGLPLALPSANKLYFFR